jgi:hypothetical protein
MTRKTEAEFLAEIDELDKAQRYALAMQRATREALRARGEEARLSADLAQKDEAIEHLREALAGRDAGALVILTPEELAQKDATIKGLANALTALKEAAPTTCEVEAVLDDVDAALRMAGVLK